MRPTQQALTLRPINNVDDERPTKFVVLGQGVPRKGEWYTECVARPGAPKVAVKAVDHHTLKGWFDGPLPHILKVA